MAGRVAGKIAVVTGANAGIGFETAKELCLQGGQVLLLCRNEERANAAIDRMTSEGCSKDQLKFVPCNLASFKSVRECSARILKEFDRIDILINNAGIGFGDDFVVTEDGHEATWQSNHLGPFLLTQNLLPLVEKSPAGRIIFVSSRAHARSERIDLGMIDKEEHCSRWFTYPRTKLANVLTTRELSRRLQAKEGNKVTVNALHPGVVATDLIYKHPLMRNWPMQYLMSWFMKSEAEGAATSLHLAMSPDVEGKTAGYYCDCALTTEGALARDEDACAELYEYSMNAVGLGQ